MHNMDFSKAAPTFNLLGRFICAEDTGAVYLSDSISHKHPLPLEAGGSSGAATLQVREDGHHVSWLHV